MLALQILTRQLILRMLIRLRRQHWGKTLLVTSKITKIVFRNDLIGMNLIVGVKLIRSQKMKSMKWIKLTKKSLIKVQCMGAMMKSRQVNLNINAYPFEYGMFILFLQMLKSNHQIKIQAWDVTQFWKRSKMKTILKC